MDLSVSAVEICFALSELYSVPYCDAKVPSPFSHFNYYSLSLHLDVLPLILPLFIALPPFSTFYNSFFHFVCHLFFPVCLALFFCSCTFCLYLLKVHISWHCYYHILFFPSFLCSLPPLLTWLLPSCCALQSPWLRAVDHREAYVSQRLMDGL